MDSDLIRKRIKFAGDVHKNLLEAGWDLATATDFVNNIPDVDAVEVVRCEKCKYRKDKMYAEPLKGFCEIHEFCTENDEFCSWGSKMDGGDE